MLRIGSRTIGISFVALLLSACTTRATTSLQPGDEATAKIATNITQLDSSATIPNDPTELVTAFVGRDGMAQRLKSWAWFDSVSVSTAGLRRDSLQIIRYFRVGATAQQGDTARIIVEFNVAGAIERVPNADKVMKTRFTDTPMDQSAMFVAVRTERGWRIASAPRTMRVFGMTYLNDPTLPPLADDDRLRLSRAFATQ